MAIERVSDLEVRVMTPITEDDIRQLQIGDHVRISGTIYTDDCEGRDLLDEGRKEWRNLDKLGSYPPRERIVVAGGS